MIKKLVDKLQWIMPHKLICIQQAFGEQNKIIQFHYFNMSLTFSDYRSDLQENKRLSRADARIVPRDCGPTLLGPTLLGPSLRWVDITRAEFTVGQLYDISFITPLYFNNDLCIYTA